MPLPIAALGALSGGFDFGSIATSIGSILGIGGSKASIRRKNAKKWYKDLPRWVTEIVPEDIYVAASHPERQSEWIKDKDVPRLNGKNTEQEVTDYVNLVVKDTSHPIRNEIIRALGERRKQILRGEVSGSAASSVPLAQQGSGQQAQQAGFSFGFNLPTILIGGVVLFMLYSLMKAK